MVENEGGMSMKWSKALGLLAAGSSLLFFPYGCSTATHPDLNANYKAAEQAAARAEAAAQKAENSAKMAQTDVTKVASAESNAENAARNANAAAAKANAAASNAEQAAAKGEAIFNKTLRK
jgi:hypothetical protein